MDLLTTMKEGSGWAQKEFLKESLGRLMWWKVLKEWVGSVYSTQPIYRYKILLSATSERTCNEPSPSVR
jgi:hypothetical protein